MNEYLDREMRAVCGFTAVGLTVMNTIYAAGLVINDGRFTTLTLGTWVMGWITVAVALGIRWSLPSPKNSAVEG